MSVFDLVILAILAALTLRGIWKGMISQIVSVASFFVCWIVATRFGSLVAPTIPLEAPWNQVAAMAIIFVITLIAIRFAYAVLEKLIKHWHLDKLNTFLGGVLGFTKGLLLCLIITFFSVMFSETSRDIVLNSKSGFYLVQIITQISVFVPKDSYEFVHTQIALFQDKVEEAVPGRAPETLPIQSSETVRQMLAQLQRTQNPPESSGSLLTALSKWWKGSKENTNNVPETLAPDPQTYQQSEPSLLPVVTYTLLPPPVASQSAVPEDFFQKRAGSILSPMVQQPLPPSAPEIPDLPPLLSSLPMLAPLTPILPEMGSQLVPIMLEPYPIGSDLLLRNSSQETNSGTSAKVFQTP